LHRRDKRPADNSVNRIRAGPVLRQEKLRACLRRYIARRIAGDAREQGKNTIIFINEADLA